MHPGTDTAVLLEAIFNLISYGLELPCKLIPCKAAFIMFCSILNGEHPPLILMLVPHMGINPLVQALQRLFVVDFDGILVGILPGAGISLRFTSLRAKRGNQSSLSVRRRCLPV